MTCLNRYFFLKIASLFVINSLHATTPRITLSHFEKDLQQMAKSSKHFAVKQGSFVDRLATKRSQKDVIEEELAKLQQEVDDLQKEVTQLQQIFNHLEQSCCLEIEKIEDQKLFAEHVVTKLVQEQIALKTIDT
ncbi:hypothetical protein FJ364_05670 [Candidatus Dependentiae bacterium]|nr:hypothetical protein [Candidatus Dependentiae bacterium]